MRLALLALALLAACVIVQIAGMLLLIHWLVRVRHILESPSVRRRAGLLLRLFVWIVLLHLLQVSLWAVVFWRARELATLEAAVYFSLVTYTTIGFGDIVLGPGWAGAGGNRGPYGSPATRLVDGVRICGRESYVRALEAGARRALTTARGSYVDGDRQLLQIGSTP